MKKELELLKCKKTIMLVGVFMLMLLFFPIEAKASTGGRSADDAINWARSQVGKGLDYDGAYGNQCVDFICYYYQYLGQRSPGGNGSDYTWNALPAGWTRIQGAVPRKGDILVYTGGFNNYGHVAIYSADRETYHQNFDSHPYVEKITYKYNGLTTPYWGVIRPDFGSAPANNFTSVSASEVGTNSAKLTATTSLTWISECGYQIGKSTNSMSIAEKEWPNSNTLNIWYTATNLEPGTTYYYQFYYISGGVVQWSEVKSFTTLSIPTTGVSLDKTSMTLKVGETSKLNATVLPANATNKSVSWSSNNNAVATVTNGTVNAVNVGEATITATTSNGQTAKCQVKVTAAEGWEYTIQGWKYRKADGSYAKDEWLVVEGYWYHFDESGYRETGWIWVNGTSYYLYDDGHMATNEWIDGYYVDGSGAWVENEWVITDGKWWYRHADGSYTTNGWESINGYWYFFDESGYMKTGWIWVNGTSYYLYDDGHMATNEWIDGYYVDGCSGAWVQDEWILTDGKWWYRHADGSYTTNGWESINGYWYFFDGNGYMQTGWLNLGGTWYYLKSGGEMASNEWVEINGYRYFFNASGVYVA